MSHQMAWPTPSPMPPNFPSARSPRRSSVPSRTSSAMCACAERFRASAAACFGHAYFTLKDENAAIDAVVWKTSYARLTFKPQEGFGGHCHRPVDDLPALEQVSDRHRQYRACRRRGADGTAGGAAAQAPCRGTFCARAEAPPAYLPRVIGVITSPTGAVIRDILHRLDDRFPSHVLVWPVRVQGETCAPEVVNAIEGFNALEPGGAIPRPDLLIVAVVAVRSRTCGASTRKPWCARSPPAAFPLFLQWGTRPIRRWSTMPPTCARRRQLLPRKRLCRCARADRLCRRLGARQRQATGALPAALGIACAPRRPACPASGSGFRPASAPRPCCEQSSGLPPALGTGSARASGTGRTTAYAPSAAPPAAGVGRAAGQSGAADRSRAAQDRRSRALHLRSAGAALGCGHARLVERKRAQLAAIGPKLSPTALRAENPPWTGAVASIGDAPICGMLQGLTQRGAALAQAGSC